MTQSLAALCGPFTPDKAAHLTATGCRSARALLGWSMRDLQAQSGVSLPTIVKIEADEAASHASRLQIVDAFFRFGVELTDEGAAACFWKKGGVELDVVTLLQRQLRYIVFLPRIDGTWRVLFQVPARLRPPGWAPTTPLPITGARSGKLEPTEVAAIRRDAIALHARLSGERLSQAFKEADMLVDDRAS